MSNHSLKFNPPPGWPKPPDNWKPPEGWKPDESWPSPPEGWKLWVSHEVDDAPRTTEASGESSSPNTKKPPLSREELEAENLSLHAKLKEIQDQLDEGGIINLNDEQVLQSVGIYRYHHPLESAAAYKDELKTLQTQMVVLIKAQEAVKVSSIFTFENSLAKGQKMARDLGKLMLRAYNAESDNCIRALRAGNVETAKKRLEVSFKAVAKLGSMMEIRISDPYHQLRIKEIELTSDWLMKKQEEKERAREERARIREEKQAEKELAAERERLNKEKSHLENAIKALSNSGEDDPELQAKLEEIQEAIDQNDYRIANIRSGYVYVISNRGAFGENIVKIGLTRRLNPQERIMELSGASVPFKFDVHALFFSEDAVTLENELHHHFKDHALNLVNQRKEFFFAKPSDVKDVLLEKVGSLLEFTETAESTEFLQSRKYWNSSESIET